MTIRLLLQICSVLYDFTVTCEEKGTAQDMYLDRYALPMISWIGVNDIFEMMGSLELVQSPDVVSLAQLSGACIAHFTHYSRVNKLGCSVHLHIKATFSSFGHLLFQFSWTRLERIINI